MASSYITFSNATISSLVNQTLTNWYLLQRIAKEMDALIGSPADWTVLETTYGLGVGKGQAFYNTIVGLKAAMDTACIPLANLDKQG